MSAWQVLSSILERKERASRAIDSLATNVEALHLLAKVKKVRNV